MSSEISQAHLGFAIRDTGSLVVDPSHQPEVCVCVSIALERGSEYHRSAELMTIGEKSNDFSHFQSTESLPLFG